MHDYSLAHGIGPGERNDKDDLAGFGRGLERATRLDPWLPHAWPMAAFPEAHTSDGYMPGFGGALRGFQIDAGLYPDGVARPGGPTERALAAALDPDRGGRSISADEVYRGAPPGTTTVPTGRPADSGVKAAAELRKLAQRAAAAGAPNSRDGGKSSSNGGAGASRPPVATVPPPRIRQPVGEGGVNAHGDLLQAQRNLARLGYAPPVAGIGETLAARSAAVQAGLRAYQHAKGLKTDGRMTAGGETERQLHRQIQAQQKILKKQVEVDAKRAANDLAEGGASGGAASTAARTLGARTAGAKVEAAAKQAYAEALDRMKRGMAGTTADSGAGTGAPATAATGSVAKADGEIRIDEFPGAGTAPVPANGTPVEAKAGTGGNRSAAGRDQHTADTPASPGKPADATAGAEKNRPQGIAAHPIVRARVRRAEQRAEAQKRAAQRAKEAAEKAAYDSDQEKSNELLRDRIGTDALSLTPDRKRKLALDVAVEAGSPPSASTGWFDELGQDVERAQGRSLTGNGDTAHSAQDRRTLLEGYAYLERVRALVEAKPHNWLGVTPRWRALAGVVESLEKGESPKTEDERVALMVRAGRRIDENFRQSRGDSLRLIGEFMSFVPGPGEAIALVQGIDAFLDGERAAAAGRSDEAEKLRVEAAILLATAIPGAGRLVKLLHKATKSLGAKTGRSLTALAERVQKRAQGKEGRGRSHSPASRRKKNTEDGGKVPVPGPWKLWLEQRLIDVPSLKQDTAQKMLFRITRPRKGLGRNPNVAQVFEGVLPELTRRQRRNIRKKYRRMFGPAGEEHLVWLMKSAGDDTVQHTNKHFKAGGVRFGADAHTTYKYGVTRRNRLAPVRNTDGGTIFDHKAGGGARTTKAQDEAQARMKEGKPAKAMDKHWGAKAKDVRIAKSDFHEYNLRQIEKIIVEDLGIGKYLTPRQIDRVMRNVTELHKASMPSRAIKFGSVMAFVMISAAVMAAQSDSGQDDDAPYPVTP